MITPRKWPPTYTLHTHLYKSNVFGVTGDVDLVKPFQAHVVGSVLAVVGNVGAVGALTGRAEFADRPVLGRREVIVLADGLGRDFG